MNINDDKIKRSNEDDLKNFTFNYTNVYCSRCGDQLCDFEIDMHKYVGITNPLEMMCQSCWMIDAYKYTN